MPVNRRRRSALTWRRPDDRGAVAVLVSVLLSGGVLLGMLALVVDVGLIYAERNQLQNGADAAALAVAKVCATTPADCTTKQALVDVAQRYANDNAADGASHVVDVCGHLSFSLALSDCDPAGDSAMCLGAVPNQDFVEVRLSTELADGRTVLPPTFAQTMANGTLDGTTVGACARAVWGPRPLTILAMTISSCEFDDATDHGTHYGSQTRPDSHDEYVIEFWSDAHSRCTTQAVDPGWAQPGPAGILQGASASCRIGIDSSGVVNAATEPWEPFEVAFEPCEDRMDSARWVSSAHPGDVIYLPVHDEVRPNGSAYHHYQVAPFLVTAYQLGAPPSAHPPYDPAEHRVGSALPGSSYSVDPCGTPVVRYRCITGIFLHDPIPIEALTNTARIRLAG